MESKIKAMTSGCLHQHSYNSLLLTLLLGIFLSLLISVPGATTTETAEDANDAAVTNVSTIDRLHMSLFNNYDRNAQPTVKGLPTNISLGLTVIYIDIDEMNGKITMHCWLNVRWSDERRSWNVAEYDNITQLHMRAREVWKPQITLFNAAGDDGNYLVDTQVMLAYDGSFLWVPPAVYTAYCNLNMRQWPYDKQMCKLKIGSWSLNNIDASYEKLNTAITVDYDWLEQSTEWEILRGKAKYVRQEYLNYIEFSFLVQRRSSMYTAVIYTPALCIVILALSTFWLPPQMGEKILLNGILIVLIAAFLMYFAQLLPVLAQNTPLIVIFYSSSLLMLSISTIIEVLVLYLSTAKFKRRIPDMIKRMLHGKLGNCLLLSEFTFESQTSSLLGNGNAKELDEHMYEDLTNPIAINPTEVPSARAIQFDWVLLATAIDRICFATFSIVFLILATVYAF